MIHEAGTSSILYESATCFICWLKEAANWYHILSFHPLLLRPHLNSFFRNDSNTTSAQNLSVIITMQCGAFNCSPGTLIVVGCGLIIQTVPMTIGMSVCTSITLALLAHNARGLLERSGCLYLQYSSSKAACWRSGRMVTGMDHFCFIAALTSVRPSEMAVPPNNIPSLYHDLHAFINILKNIKQVSDVFFY